ncbi:MAG: hypothetical protein LBR07_05125 [Puniceicoccales bacterium]|jgi:hypothetical protein|nr:hypothetical protein [Puniceicoccales bacterium]
MQLLKKPNSRNWFVRFRVCGTYHSLSTGTADRREALAAARALHLAARAGTLRGGHSTAARAGSSPGVHAGTNTGTTAALSTYAQIADLYAAYAAERARSGDIAPTTWRANLHALDRYLALIGTDRSAPCAPDRATAERYRLAATRDLTPAARAARANTINSTLRFVRSLFSRSALDYYYRHGATLDEATLTGFLRAPLLPASTPAFAAPSPDALRALDTAGWALWHGTPDDRQLHIAYLLFRHFGLRNREALHLRANWFELDEWENSLTTDHRPLTTMERSGSPVPILHLVLRNRDDFAFKRHGERETRIAVSPDLAHHLLTILADIPPTHYLLYPQHPSRAAHTPAHDLVYRRISHLVQTHLGKTGSKTTYNLRKLYGSEVLTATGSIEAAAAALRNTPAVARAHYARYLTPVTTTSPSPTLLTTH